MSKQRAYELMEDNEKETQKNDYEKGGLKSTLRIAQKK